MKTKIIDERKAYEVTRLAKRLENADSEEQIFEVLLSWGQIMFDFDYSNHFVRAASSIDALIDNPGAYVAEQDTHWKCRDAYLMQEIKKLAHELAKHPATPPDILRVLDSQYSSGVSLNPMLPIYIDANNDDLFEMIRNFYSSDLNNSSRQVFQYVEFQGPIPDPRMVDLISRTLGEIIEHAGQEATAQILAIPRQSKVNGRWSPSSESWLKKMRAWSRVACQLYRSPNPFGISGISFYLMQHYLKDDDYVRKSQCNKGLVQFVSHEWIRLADDGNLLAGAAKVVQFLREAGEINGKPLGRHLLSQILDQETT